MSDSDPAGRPPWLVVLGSHLDAEFDFLAGAEMFDLAPVSLWLEDFSGVRRLFDEWRAAGVTDIGCHLRADPARIDACTSRIRVAKVNQRTLELFEAANLEALVENLGNVLRSDKA